MKKLLLFVAFTIAAVIFGLNGAEAQKGATGIDVQHYKIDAELVPASQLLRGRAEVRFVPLGETRSAVFELNGALSVKRVTMIDSSLGAGVPATRDSKPKTAKDAKPISLAAT